MGGWCQSPIFFWIINFCSYVAYFVFNAKYFLWKNNATLTSEINTGTSTSGPITAANASPECKPNTPIATAIANSKLLLAAVNDKVAVFE